MFNAISHAVIPGLLLGSTSLFGIGAAPAASASQVAPAHVVSTLAGQPPSQFHIVGTDGDGVWKRSDPYQWAITGPGPHDGDVMNLLCHRTGDPVGEHGNRIWWLVMWNGDIFYVSDHWLDTPYSPDGPIVNGFGDCNNM